MVTLKLNYCNAIEDSTKRVSQIICFHLMITPCGGGSWAHHFTVMYTPSIRNNLASRDYDH